MCTYKGTWSALPSLHQYIDGGVPPEGSVKCLTVVLLSGEVPVLINHTNL